MTALGAFLLSVAVASTIGTVIGYIGMRLLSPCSNTARIARRSADIDRLYERLALLSEDTDSAAYRKLFTKLRKLQRAQARELSRNFDEKHSQEFQAHVKHSDELLKRWERT